MGLNPKGRNWGQLVNWDDLGKFYTGFIISWSIILYAGVIWLILNRHLAFVKIRNLPLSIAAISFLHVYLIKIFLAYTTNGHFACGAEFWIMSIYLPFGIALVQASLVQLRAVFDEQQKYLRYTPESGYTWPSQRVHGLWNWWTSRSKVQKAYILIGLGMVIQFIITGALYGATPTLQGDWTSYGPISHAKGQAKCRKSAVWVPSAFWQLFYAWVYGPYVLYSVRNIHDTHHWRLQVILTVVSGLPGTPLWLAAVFSDGFKEVNRWWVPPMWLAPGIIVMQATTIFFPICEAILSNHRGRKILSLIDEWQSRHSQSGSNKRLTADSTSYEESTSARTSSSSRKSQMYTMASLEKALAVNPRPLLVYAATKDFTAENIVFLMQVRRWRATYTAAAGFNGRVTDEPRALLFASAVDIYTACVNEKTSEYPINVESSIRNTLDAIFSRAVPEGKYTPNPNSGDFDRTVERMTMDRETSNDSSDPIWEKGGHVSSQKESMFGAHPGVAPLGKSRARIPAEFNEFVFDAAEQSIKYLVLTNTWWKFVSSVEAEGSTEKLALEA